MRSNLGFRRSAERFNGLVTAATEILRLRSWSALARISALGLLLALPSTTARADDPSETTPVAQEAPAAPARSPATAFDATPRPLGPSASPEWVERLSQARRRVLEATAASDAANESYAQALYSDVPEGPELDAFRARRTETQRALVEARKATAALVDQARADGVSLKTLKVYQESMPR